MDLNALNRLLTVMEGQAALMDSLVELGRAAAAVLVAGDLPRLEGYLRGEQALIWQIGRLEERRFHLQQEVAASLQLHPGALTLQRLLQQCPPAEASRCQTVADRFSTVVGELARVNQLNGELIQQAMAFVDFAIAALGGRETGGQIYSPEGSKGQAESRLRRLDSRV